MRLLILLLVAVYAAGCQTAKESTSATSLHPMFLKSRLHLDGEYAERYVSELLSVARRIGPKAFVGQLSREDPSTQRAVVQLLLPLLGSPTDKMLRAELEKLRVK